MPGNQNTVRRIVFTGDFLRPPLGFQDLNIDRLVKIVGRPLSRVSTLPIDRISCADGPEPFEAAWRCLGLPPSTSNWARILDSPEAARQLQTLWAPYTDALVMAFEPPPCFLRAWRMLGIRYLEFCLHPIRYLRQDLGLGVRSNCSPVSAALREAEIAWGTIEEEASSLREWSPDYPPDASEPFVLVTAQTPEDRSVIAGGRFADLVDFRDRLDGLRRQFAVRVRPHPYMPVSSSVERWIGESPRSALCQEPTYSLFRHPQLQSVVSLSSSTLTEAEAFGLRTMRLLPAGERFSYRDRPAPGGWHSIFEHHRNPRFWAATLAGLIPIHRGADEWVGRDRGHLRHIFGQNWGWEPNLLSEPNLRRGAIQTP